MANDDPLLVPRFPAEDAEDVLWLAELIRGLRMFAESAGHPEVVAILNEAHAAAKLAAGVPGDTDAN